MNNKSRTFRRLFVTAGLVVLAAACADDAERMDRARAFAAEREYRAATIEVKNVLRSDPTNSAARVLLGEVTLATGDADTAVKELRRARELGAPPDDYALPLAEALLRQQRFQEVVSLNPALLEDVDKRARLYALIGTGEFELGDYPAAEAAFDAAVALVPEQSDALVGRARLAQARGQTDAVTANLQALLRGNPDDPGTLAAIGRLQIGVGDNAAAVQSFEAALARLEGSGRAYDQMMSLSGLVDAQLARGEIAAARASAARMIEVGAQHPLALFQAARADYAAEDYDGAIDKAGRIVTAAPQAQPPRMLLAAAALARGDRALAATHLQAAVNINPGNTTARKLLAQTRMQMGEPDEAYALLAPLIEAGTSDPQILAIAGTASIRSGAAESGVELMEQGIGLMGNDPALALQAAANFLVAGEINRAIEVLETLPADEQVGQRELLLILALLRRGDEDAARAEALAIVEARPDASASQRLLGGFHLAVGELPAARAAFERALAIDPDDPASITNLARIDVQEGQPDQAEARFNAVLERQPGNLLALTALAQLAERRGDMAAGVQLLEKARAANPDEVVPLLTLGRYYLREGQLELAEARASAATRVAPGNAEAQLLHGMVLLQDERPTEAIARFERAIGAQPNLARAHYQLGRAQIATGLADAGYKSYARAVEIDAMFFPARVALAGAEVERGNLNAALAIADGLVTDYPDRAEPLTLRGNIHFARGDFEQALEAYAAATDVEPSRSLAARQTQLRERLGMERPWRDLENWLAANPDDHVAHALLGQAYQQAGRTDQAIASYARSLEISPEAAVATRLAFLHREAGDYDRAARRLDQARQLDPGATPARAALASLELQRGNTARALELARELTRDDPGNADSHIIEGNVLLETGNYAGAIAAFDLAAELAPSEQAIIRGYEARDRAGREDAWRVLERWFADHPGHVNAGILLAQDYGEREWYDESVETYRQVLAADPTNLIALNNLAWIYDQRGAEGDLDRAVNAAARAYEQQPDLAAVADTYGWVLYRSGQTERALPLLEKAAAGADVDPEIRYHLAAALDSAGRDAEAVALLDELLADAAQFDSRADAEALRRRLAP